MNSQSTTQTFVTETTAESFEHDVLERSREVPVVVDFWAPWCGPCRMLSPVLERLTAEYGGRFVLVKANTDQLPDAAAAFQVQSIPAVFGVTGGEVADAFAGALPEQQVRVWIDRLLSRHRLTAAAGREDSDPAGAAAAYRQLLEEWPNESRAAIGLARVLIRLQELDEARAVLEKLEERGFLEPEAEQLKADLDLQARECIDVDACRRAAENAPDDLAAQLKYAEALAGARQYEEALQRALSLVQRDRNGVGEPARQLMIDIFRVVDESELVSEYRRKLSMALY